MRQKSESSESLLNKLFPDYYLFCQGVMQQA